MGASVQALSPRPRRFGDRHLDAADAAELERRPRPPKQGAIRLDRRMHAHFVDSTLMPALRIQFREARVVMHSLDFFFVFEIRSESDRSSSSSQSCSLHVNDRLARTKNRQSLKRKARCGYLEGSVDLSDLAIHFASFADGGAFLLSHFFRGVPSSLPSQLYAPEQATMMLELARFIRSDGLAELARDYHDTAVQRLFPKIILSPMVTTPFGAGILPHSQDAVTHIDCNTPSLQQAFRSTELKRTPECISPDKYIDPVHALSSQAATFFGQGLVCGAYHSSGSGQHQAVHGGFSAEAPSVHVYSSCDEDAEGEPDESYNADHSFWTTETGDTSFSTVASLAADEIASPFPHPHPAQGGKAPHTMATRGDVHFDADLPHDSSLGAQLTFGPSNSAQSSTTMQRSVSSLDGAFAITAKRRRRSSSTRSQSASLVQGTASRSRKGSTASKALAHALISNTSTRDPPLRESEGTGSGSGTSGLSSPSSGKYKLRKKDEVPRRSLAALFTPPGERLTGYFDEGERDTVSQAEETSPGPALSMMADRSSAPAGLSTQAYRSGAEDLPEMLFADMDALEDIKPATVREKGQRIFPKEWEIHAEFPLLYQRYLVPSSVSPEVLEMLLRGLGHNDFEDELRETVDRAQTVHGSFNKPRSILDLYTPRFVKGVGAQKVGMCPICYEEGMVRFFKTKFSAYNYHLQNFHGVSALTGLPFTPPIKFRTRVQAFAKPKERKQLIQGLCHACHKYVDMQGPKQTELKVVEIYWWKHAQSCHRKADVPDAIAGYFVENLWYARVHAVLEMIGGYHSEVEKLLAGPK